MYFLLKFDYLSKYPVTVFAWSWTSRSQQPFNVLAQECPTYGPRATIRRFYPAREVSQKCQKWQICVYQVCFSSSKIRQNLFSAWAPPHTPTGGAYDAPQDPLVSQEGGHPLPIPFCLDAFSISIWPPTSWNLYTWPSGQKGWTPLF